MFPFEIAELNGHLLVIVDGRYAIPYFIGCAILALYAMHLANKPQPKPNWEGS